VFKDGELDCLFCQSYNRECTFVEVPKPRKKRAPRNAAIPEDVAVVSVSPAASSSQATQHVPNYNSSTELIADEACTTNILSELHSESLGLQLHHHSRYIGACSMMSFISPLTSGAREGMPTNCSLRKVGSTDRFLIIPDEGTQGYETESQDLEAIQAIVTPHGTALINIFFRVIHGSYPLLHKPYYQDRSRRFYQNFSPPLLASIYLLALRYWSYDAELAEFTKPNEIELENLARKTLLNDFHRPKLSTIAAGLFMLQYSDLGSAELTSQLISVGFGLGIHVDASNWDIRPWEIGLRKQIGWALYMQDTWSALGSGRPRLISASNWNVQPLTHDDFSEHFTEEHEQEGSSEVEKGKVLFSYMVSLTEILADVLETMYTMQVERELKSASDGGLGLILQKAKPLQLRLKEWSVDLPKSLSMNSTQALKLSSAGSLRLDYLATEAMIHRRILTTASQGSTDSHLWQIIQSAASSRFVSAIEFVQALKPQELMSFWYTASKTNLALIGSLGIILCTTASTPADRTFFMEKLKAYRWALKVNHVAGAQFMKPAVSLLDANIKVLATWKQPGMEQNEDAGETNQVDVTAASDAYRSRSHLEVEEWAMSPGLTLPNDDFFGVQFFSGSD
jgi:hypothetical protein